MRLPPGKKNRQGGGGNGRSMTQMALNIFRHGRSPWEEDEEEEEEEEEEGEGDEFDNNHHFMGSTPLGNHAERRLLSETKTSGGTTAPNKIATAEKKVRRRRKWQGNDTDGAQHLLPWEVTLGGGEGGGGGRQV
jgi:hypothetical protein